MLDADAASRGANFLTPEIFDVARSRIAAGAGVEPFRCLHNMLSSQPMCFNLLGPLVADSDLATRLIEVLLPGEIEEVLEIRIEYAPSPRKDYLDDRTAFDALIVYRRPDGDVAFFGVETKLTEPFSPLEYVKQSYVGLTEREDSIWRRDAWPTLRASASNQLWRNQLLVEATRRHPQHPHGLHGRSVIVRHPLDGDCASAVAAYVQTLVEAPATFVDWPLDEVIARWNTVVSGDEERAWLTAFERRYLDLDASAGQPRTAVPRGTPDERLVAARPIAPRAEFGDGIWEVGVDIEPGLYEANAGPGAYWARLADFTGNAILGNGLTDRASHLLVEILVSDAGFKSDNCGQWRRRR